MGSKMVLGKVVVVLFVFALAVLSPSVILAKQEDAPAPSETTQAITEGTAAAEEVKVKEVKVKEEAPAAPAQPSASDLKKKNVADFMAKGQEDNAIKELEDAIASDQYTDIKEWATLELYQVAVKKNVVAEVVADLQKAETQNSTNIEIKKAIAEGYVRERDWSKVVVIYEDLAKKAPDDHTYKTRLTDYYILAGQFDKAIARLEPLVTANPNDSYNSDILANAYTQAGMSDKALALYKRKVDADPTSPGLRGRYAQALQNFGKYAEALAEWKKAYGLDPLNGFFKVKADEVTALMKK